MRRRETASARAIAFSSTCGGAVDAALLLLLLLLLLLDDLDTGDVFDEPLVLFAGVVVTGGPLDMSAVVPSALAA